VVVVGFFICYSFFEMILGKLQPKKFTIGLEVGIDMQDSLK
jgi:hypothetical protein